jgi:Ca2+-binding RTX toxin-like protein
MRTEQMCCGQQTENVMAIIKGTTGNDTLFGTDLFDTINGSAGDDIIDGGAGNDKMAGDTGNDTFIGGAGADFMDGGSGVDTINYANSSSGVKVFLGAGYASGGQAEGDTFVSIENVTGSQYRDTLFGTDGRNTINGGGGDDTISAGGDNDIVFGGNGNDWMAGGNGSDTFVFTSAFYGSQNGMDTIADFRVGEDILEFRSAGWAGPIESLEDLAFSQVGNDTVISYGNAGESITLVGVDVAQLHLQAATSFLFT